MVEPIDERIHRDHPGYRDRSAAAVPLAKGTLKQAVSWDGKDDLGKAAKDGPFKVRVRLGLKPELAGFLGDNPAALGSVRALATGPGGPGPVSRREDDLRDQPARGRSQEQRGLPLRLV
jgi:hypothetical protein